MKYSGSCHCQRIKFSCEFELSQPTLCNCSYCEKRHAVLHIIDDIKIQEGNHNLSCYRFNKLKGARYFCRYCGIFIYSTPPKPVYPYAINLCTLDACDWRDIELNYFDGKIL